MKGIRIMSVGDDEPVVGPCHEQQRALSLPGEDAGPARREAYDQSSLPFRLACPAAFAGASRLGVSVLPDLKRADQRSQCP
jgi:hypothetical protein